MVLEELDVDCLRSAAQCLAEHQPADPLTPCGMEQCCCAGGNGPTSNATRCTAPQPQPVAVVGLPREPKFFLICWTVTRH